MPASLKRSRLTGLGEVRSVSLGDGASTRDCVDLRQVDPRLRVEDFGMMVSGRDEEGGGYGTAAFEILIENSHRLCFNSH